MSEEPGRTLSAGEVGPFRYRRSRSGDGPQLAALFSSIHTPRSLDEWRWIFERAPEGPADVDVLAAGDRVVGCLAHVPVKAWVERRMLRLAIGCDLMILPEHRSLGGAGLLCQGFLESNHEFDLNFGVVNEASSRITGRLFGTVTMGAATGWVRTARRGQRFRAPPRLAITAAERGYGSAMSFPRPRLEVVELGDPGSDVDDLAHDSAAFAPCIRVRDAAYLRWHWLEQPGAAWRIRAVRSGDRMEGFIVFGVREQDGTRTGIIGDLLARSHQATRALVVDAWNHLAADGCDRVWCIYGDPRPWSRRALLRSGFRPTEGPTLACGPLSSAAGDVVSRLGSWYVTYGDTDI